MTLYYFLLSMIVRDGSKAAATSKMERFVIHLWCCSRPRYASDSNISANKLNKDLQKISE